MLIPKRLTTCPELFPDYLSMKIYFPYNSFEFIAWAHLLWFSIRVHPPINPNCCYKGTCIKCIKIRQKSVGNSHPNIFTGYASGPKVTVVSIQIQIHMLLFVTVIKHLYSATQWQWRS